MRATRSMLALVAAAGGFLAPIAVGMWVQPTLMPVDRVIANLEKKIAEDPRDADAVYNLGRARYLAWHRVTSEIGMFSDTDVAAVSCRATGVDEGCPGNATGLTMWDGRRMSTVDWIAEELAETEATSGDAEVSGGEGARIEHGEKWGASWTALVDRFDSGGGVGGLAGMGGVMMFVSARRRRGRASAAVCEARSKEIHS